MGKRHILDKPVSRRTFVAGAAAAATALQMPWVRRASAAEFSGKEIRVLTWSDATGQAAVRNILQPFEKATGREDHRRPDRHDLRHDRQDQGLGGAAAI